MSDHFDVIIIGTGAGGGTLLHTLAPSGRRILVLERGDFLPREMENWDPGEVFVKGRYISPDTWYDGDGKELPAPGPLLRRRGMTKLYGAALYRLRPQDFGELRHVDGISPAWPLGYDDFEPWYTKAEWLYQVHGNVGEDPTEGHHSRPYPWPAALPRAPHPADRRLAGGRRLPAVPRAVRDPLRRGRPGPQHLHPLHLVRRLSLPGARQGRRRDDRGAPGAGPAQRHAAGRRPGHEAADRQRGTQGERGRRHPQRRRGALRGRHRRRLRRSGEHRQVAADVGQRRPPQRARQRLGPGRAQLRVPQQQGGGRAR